MTFKRSIITISLVFALVLICSFLAKIEAEYLWYIGLSLIATGVLFLAFNDLVLKYYTDKARDEGKERELNLKYCVGFVFIVVAVGIWIWALAFTDNLNFFGRIAAAVFLGSVGGWWFHTQYRKSLQNIEEKIFEIWEKIKKKTLKAKTPDKARKILNQNLRYYLVGDTLSNSLDLNRPIVKIDDKPVSFDEIGEGKEEDQLKMIDYIDKIVEGMGFNVPELDEINEEIGG